MSTYNEQIGKRLAQYRLGLGATMSDMAAVAGVSVKTWSRWESGGSDIPSAALSVVCEKYDLSPIWVLFGTGPIIISGRLSDDSWCFLWDEAEDFISKEIYGHVRVSPQVQRENQRSNSEGSAIQYSASGEMTDLDLMDYIATIINSIEPIEIDTGQPLGSGIVNDLIRLCSIYRIKPDDLTMLVKSILRYRD